MFKSFITSLLSLSYLTNCQLVDHELARIWGGGGGLWPESTVRFGFMTQWGWQISSCCVLLDVIFCHGVCRDSAELSVFAIFICSPFRVVRVPCRILSVWSPLSFFNSGTLSAFNFSTILYKYPFSCGLCLCELFHHCGLFLNSFSLPSFTGTPIFWLSSLCWVLSSVVVCPLALIKLPLPCLLPLSLSFLSFLALAFLGCPLSSSRELVFLGIWTI